MQFHRVKKYFSECFFSVASPPSTQWVKGAIKRPGALRAWASREGGMVSRNGSEVISDRWLNSKIAAANKGQLAQPQLGQVRLAEQFRRWRTAG
jgi:hypothetical protein